MSTVMTDRRRIAVVDGERVHEIVVSADAPLEAALDGVGVGLNGSSVVLVDRAGREVALDAPVLGLGDGALLTVVERGAGARSGRAQRKSRAHRSDAAAALSDSAAWWMLGAAAVVLGAFAITGSVDLPPLARTGFAVVAGLGACAGALTWAMRTRPAGPAAPAAALGPLALAFVAGAAAVPSSLHSLPLAVLTGLVCAAVLSGLIALVARAADVRDSAGAGTAVLLVLAAVWALVLLLGMPVQAAGAIALGVAPVALRALPSTLLDVPPGMFIDYKRFQLMRWAVRERTPEPGGSVTIDGARRIAGRASARMLSTTLLVSLVAAVSAPLALVPLQVDDPLPFWGQLVLATTAVFALILGARRSSSLVLRWTPRAVAAVVVLAVVTDLVLRSSALAASVVAAALLLTAIATAAILVAVGRGASSLFWSRLGDRVEAVCVVLALPAGLVAAGFVDLMRGVLA